MFTNLKLFLYIKRYIFLKQWQDKKKREEKSFVFYSRNPQTIFPRLEIVINTSPKSQI